MSEWTGRLVRETWTSPEPLDALEHAYRANLEVIYRYIVRRVGSPEVAEDLTAEVFLKAVRWLQSGRTPQAVQSWLYAAARTSVADYWHAHANSAVDLSLVEDRLHVGEDHQTVATAEAEQRVQHILQGLPARERQVLVLRFLEGRPTSEIAHVLETSEGNVRVLQYRALKRAAAFQRGDDERG